MTKKKKNSIKVNLVAKKVIPILHPNINLFVLNHPKINLFVFVVYDFAVVHGTNGSPTPTSEFEHSSIPATVKKMFNLSSPFLTKRDEWAGTFERVVQFRTEPRTDCPG